MNPAMAPDENDQMKSVSYCRERLIVVELTPETREHFFTTIHPLFSAQYCLLLFSAFVSSSRTFCHLTTNSRSSALTTVSGTSQAEL